MVEEIDTAKKFDHGWDFWVRPENFDFWISNSHTGLGDYDTNKIPHFIRNAFINSIRNPDAIPRIKIWGYKYKGNYISGACFAEEKHPMTNKRILTEIFWMLPGKKATTLKEKTALIKLLKHIENYGRANNFEYIQMGKVIGVHPEALDNFYLKSGYKPDSIVYSKKLK